MAGVAAGVGFFWEVREEGAFGGGVVHEDHLAAVEGANAELSDGDALEFDDVEADFFEHFADLVVFSFGDDDFIPVVFFAGFFGVGLW